MRFYSTWIATLLALMAIGCAGSQHMDKADKDGQALRLEMAEVFVKRGTYLAAAPLLRRVISEDPENMKARVLYAQVLREQGLYPQALGQYRVALKQSPRVPAIWAGMGILHDSMKDHEQAIVAHKNAVGLSPGTADYWNNLGFSYLVSGKSNSAIQALERALALDPAMTVAYNNLGFAYGRRGNYEGAHRAFRSAVGEARAYLNLALIYEDKNNAEKAEWCRAQAYEIEPNLREQLQ